MFTRLTVWDLDGTIIDSTHRYRYIENADGTRRIDLPYWRANEHKALDDTLLPLARWYQLDLQREDTFVVIATSRACKNPDFIFVREKLGWPDYFIHRLGNNDQRKAVEIKATPVQSLLQRSLFKDVKEVRFYEDNHETVQAFCERIPQAIGHYIPSKQGY